MNTYKMCYEEQAHTKSGYVLVAFDEYMRQAD